MDAYQKKALELLGINPDGLGRVASKKTGASTGTFYIDSDDAITIKGDRDIFSKDYTIRLYTGKSVAVSALFGTEWKTFEPSEFKAMDPLEEETADERTKMLDGSLIDINLDSRPTKLKLAVPGEVVDDIIIDIKYDLISEEDYWKMMNSPEMLRKNMAVTYRTGENLVNIYWKHAKENVVASVRIDLYMKSGDDRQLMGKYKTTDEVFFKSIDGLAYGDYVFELFQLDKDGNEIASSGAILFSLTKPKVPDNGGAMGRFGRQGRWKNQVVG